LVLYLRYLFVVPTTAAARWYSQVLPIGIDFGTTNSSIALSHGSGEVRLAQFAHSTGTVDAYRPLLYFDQLTENRRTTTRLFTGPRGIEQYLHADTKGRLMQSLKSFLASRSLIATDVFGKRRTLEELIAGLLKDLRLQAEEHFGQPIRRAVSGRPVRFVGADTEADDTYAQGRLQQAFHLAGFDHVDFELEPLGAAYYYRSTVQQEELILIGDFGGGTSDFSVLRVSPTESHLLGNAGVALAGDAFDAKIIRHLVSPALGAGSMLRSTHKLLPVPTWVHSKLERWHHLSLLRGKETIDMLLSVYAQAVEPEKIDALLYLVKEDLGYRLHQSVQRVKSELSSAPQAEFRFHDGPLELQATVQREAFEEWIADELEQIATCVDRLLASVNVTPDQVDRVFLTGGTSFVPAVHRIFADRFGRQRIRAGNEFTSVACGLAVKAALLESTAR
jgi:hypothetical chaperone protein